MNLKELLRYFAAIGMIVFGAFLALGGLVSIFEKRGNTPVTPADVFLFAVFGILPVILGIILFRRTLLRQAERTYEAHERSILLLAQTHGAKLTSTEVGMAMNITVQQAENLLQNMTIKGLTQLEISDSGVPVYHFHTLISRGEKHDAEDV
jgi:hypothetical protein